MLRSLSREERKDILRERPAEEFAALLNQIYSAAQVV